MLRRRGNGEFDPPVSVGELSNGENILAADLNSDGKLHIYGTLTRYQDYAGAYGNQVHVRLGRATTPSNRR